MNSGCNIVLLLLLVQYADYGPCWTFAKAYCQVRGKSIPTQKKEDVCRFAAEYSWMKNVFFHNKRRMPFVIGSMHAKMLQKQQPDGWLNLMLPHLPTRVLNLSHFHVCSNPRISTCSVIAARQLLRWRNPTSREVWICHESEDGLLESFFWKAGNQCCSGN